MVVGITAGSPCISSNWCWTARSCCCCCCSLTPWGRQVTSALTEVADDDDVDDDGTGCWGAGTSCWRSWEQDRGCGSSTVDGSTTTPSGLGSCFRLIGSCTRTGDRRICWLYLQWQVSKVKLAKYCIIDLSPLAAENGFVQSWPPPIHVSLSRHESVPRRKRHLDRFSRFCSAHERDQQTDTPTHRGRPRYSVCSSSPDLIQCMRCGLERLVSTALEHTLAWRYLSVHVTP